MSPRPQATEQLRRVLALIPYIAERGEVSIGELAVAFGVPESVIESDLEVLPFCGLPPYTPDRLIEVAVVDGHVSIRFAEYFSRPLRLTAAEGFALLAAGRALLEVPGSDPDGPLARALAKLEAALDAHDVVDVEIERHPYVHELQQASARHERVEIDYYSYGRDAVTSRLIDPYSVASLRGTWYLVAYCHRVGDERLFRVDRVQGMRRTGEHFEPPHDPHTPGEVFAPDESSVRVRLELPPAARWVADSFPVEQVTDRSDGRIEVVLAVSARPWLERVLLQAGAEARVVTPPDWQDTGAAAARRILRRYER